MASTGDADAGEAAATSAAAALRSASFVHVVAHADGRAVAAAGVLAAAARETDVPFQVSVARTAADASRRIADTDATAVVVGARDPGAAASLAGPETPADAAAAAREVGAEPDPQLVLAGLAAGGVSPEGTDAVETAGVERRPGLGTPTEDPADGLAHTTLVHGEFSGDTDAAKRTLADLGVDTVADSKVASAVALETSAPDTGNRGLAAVGRALHPFAPGGPFATVPGYGDVLDAVAREAPGTAVALALGHDARERALDAWRAHARRAHRAVREADPARHAGVVVARAGDAHWTVARLLRDFRSPEPAALVVGDGEAALAGPAGTGAAEVLSTAAAECSGSAGGGDERAYAAFDGDADDLTAVVRGML